MQVRRFGEEVKTKVPGGHPGVYAVQIQADREHFAGRDLEQVARRLNGLPIMLNRPGLVVAMYIEPHGHIDEHSSDVPILFLVTSGRGYVRIGGPQGETREITVGDAVLWPPRLDHTVWTEDEALAAIIIDGPAEREESV